MDSLISLINLHLDELTSKFNDGKVKEALRYSLLAPGKRVRPILFLLTLKAYQFPYEKYVDIACAIEMIHTYSLIHDDLPGMDNDDLRRGRPTCHKQFDEATAILAGDALLNEACLVILNSVLDNDKKVALTKVLYENSGVNGMIYGQQQDLYYENKQATLEQLRDIHTHKTGCLLKVPFIMAGIIIENTDMNILNTIGTQLGIAFQIQDDILDIIGDKALLGKNTGSDLENNKSTYVSLLGLDKSKQYVEEYFNSILNLLNQLHIDSQDLINYFKYLIKRES